MPKLARNSHNLSHYRLLTHDMGQLVPVGAVEVLPGDSFKHSSRAMMRVQPMLKPVMHPVDCRIHHFFVPFRLVWDNWEAMITGRSADTVPQITVTNQARGSLADHLGLPCDGTTDYTVNALPFRAYSLIYNEFFRDQNLINPLTISTANGPDTTTNIALQRIAWEKDYFTTARANPQFGSASVEIPFSAGTQAPIIPLTGGGKIIHKGATGQADVSITVDHGTAGAGSVYLSTGINDSTYPNATTGTEAVDLILDPDAGNQLFADLSNVVGGGINVNDLREAMAMQSFLEHRNRYGSRYTDYLRFLGIRPRDSRLQRPEYLGGGRNVISFSEVLSTAEAGTQSVGDLAGHGIAAVSTRPYRFFFEESGIVLSLMSVRPRAIYSQYVQRMWLRSDKFDFWQKELEAMGPQEIFVKELYGLHANATDVFGYNGRHDDYRHHASYVSGEFRDGGTEEDWHLARDFSTSPALNSTFIDCVPTERIYADTVTPELYTMVTHNLRASRAVSQVSRH